VSGIDDFVRSSRNLAGCRDGGRSESLAALRIGQGSSTGGATPLL